MNSDDIVFVAGHTGMVGSAFVRKLTQKGFTRVIVRTRTELDLTCQRDVDQFFAKHRIRHVILAAAKVGGIYANMSQSAQFIYENLQIQNNIIHSAYRNGVKKLLFLGSSCIYPRQCPQPIREEYLLTGPLEPTNEAYAIAKIAGIKLCEHYYRQYGCNFISVMPTNLYGPEDNFDLETSHVLPALLRKFHEGKIAREAGAASTQKDDIAVTIWGSGQPRREFLHVEDAVEACLFVMKHVEADVLYAQGLSHLNIGSGEDMTIAELCRLIESVVGYQGPVVFDTEKPDGTPRKQLDVSRLHQLGWSHRISLEQGLRQTYRWYLQQLGKGALTERVVTK